MSWNILKLLEASTEKVGSPCVFSSRKRVRKEEIHVLLLFPSGKYSTLNDLRIKREFREQREWESQISHHHQTLGRNEHVSIIEYFK